jgi:hypothetical protein
MITEKQRKRKEILISDFDFSIIRDFPCTLSIEKVSTREIKKKIKEGKIISKISSAPMKYILQTILKHEIKFADKKIVFKKGDVFIVAKIVHTPTLPIRFYRIVIK